MALPAPLSGHNKGEEVTGICLFKNSLLISFPANSLFNVPSRKGGAYISEIAMHRHRQLCPCGQNKPDYNLDAIINVEVLLPSVLWPKYTLVNKGFEVSFLLHQMQASTCQWMQDPIK